jgi:hypothetical protein
MEHVEKILLSRPPIQGDQVDEAPTDIRGGVPNDGGGEVQGNQEDHHQDDALQEVLSKVEKMPLDKTVTNSTRCRIVWTRDPATIVGRRAMVLVPSWREKASVKPLVKPVEFATNYTIWQRCASRDLPT